MMCLPLKAHAGPRLTEVSAVLAKFRRTLLRLGRAVVPAEESVTMPFIFPLYARAVPTIGMLVRKTKLLLG